MPHSNDWALQAKLLAAHIKRQLPFPFIDLQQIGSTSVPGLVAKPKLHLDVTVGDDQDVRTAVTTLTKTAGKPTLSPEYSA
ncbi:GrpB family protein [Roseibium algae]|uniref:GrpB family protein n=1 Tax=Roseibium algae TaxID=3123038 RepID=UPI003BF5C76C